MSSTTPSMFGVEIQSSTANGLSSRMTRPPKRFCAVSCAASAKVKPPRPRPVMMVVTLVPVSLRMAMAARTIKSTLSAFFKKVISVLLRLTSSCSSSLLPKRKKESEAQSHSSLIISLVTGDFSVQNRMKIRMEPSIRNSRILLAMTSAMSVNNEEHFPSHFLLF